MLIIRELSDSDMLQAIQLKALCWPEELAGLSDNKLDIEKEHLYWVDWMHTEVDNNDVRTLIGAFENGQLLGVAFASYAEKEDSDCGIELNGLWVDPLFIIIHLPIRFIVNLERLCLKQCFKCLKNFPRMFLNVI